jgi:hypothetical protein
LFSHPFPSPLITSSTLSIHASSTSHDRELPQRWPPSSSTSQGRELLRRPGAHAPAAPLPLNDRAMELSPSPAARALYPPHSLALDRRNPHACKLQAPTVASTSSAMVSARADARCLRWDRTSSGMWASSLARASWSTTAGARHWPLAPTLPRVEPPSAWFPLGIDLYLVGLLHPQPAAGLLRPSAPLPALQRTGGHLQSRWPPVPPSKGKGWKVGGGSCEELVFPAAPRQNISREGQ